MKSSNYHVKLLFAKSGQKEFDQLLKKYNARNDISIWSLKQIMWSQFEEKIQQ